jgi:predicted HTH domain antitoxin
MSQLTISLPETITEDEARRLLALKLFEVGRLSAGQAAEFVGCSKRAFMELSGKYGVPTFDHSTDELTDDLRHA